MMRSMTGFGSGEAKDQNRHLTVEIKSVNHKYNDVLVRLPKNLNYLEERIKKTIKEKIKRGRVEVYISSQNIGENDEDILYNRPLAEKYLKCFKTMEHELGISDDISVSLLASLPDVLVTVPKKEDEQTVWLCLGNALIKALDMLVEMRTIEGKKLEADISMRCDYIVKFLDKIKNRAPKIVLEYQKKLKERLFELLHDSIEVDENRLNMEIALFADKSNITEEIVRLRSHISQFRETIRIQAPVGRKLDFLIQEMNREINTIGSKASDLEITNNVVNIKSELEKIREQIQNIE